jgi:hypothetical protein
MTTILTIRVPVDLLSRAEARAHRLGLDRAKYVRQLIEQDTDAAGEAGRSGAGFASEDLAGRFKLGGRSATNRRVRQRLRTRAAREATR